MAGRPGKSGNYRPVLERLMEKAVLNLETHCVEWTGSLNNRGYPSFKGGHDLPGTNYAHRVAYLLWNGPIPEGYDIDHRCNNPKCINPQHLWAVTHRENSRFAKRSDKHVQARKTHCPKGHPYDETNTRWYKNERSCITCRREQKKRRRLEQKASMPAV